MQLIVNNTSLTKAQLSWWGFIHRDKSYVEDWEPHIFKRVLLPYLNTSYFLQYCEHVTFQEGEISKAINVIASNIPEKQ